MASEEIETLPPVQTSPPGSWLLSEPGEEVAVSPAQRRRYQERYEELGMLGEGGMGRVLRVLDRDLNRVVAMKTLRSALQGSEAQVRFLNEAQVGAQLEHPGILPVYDIGHRPDGRLYFTMREIQGSTLASVIKESHQGGGWGLHRLVDAYHRVCEAMAYVHSRGVTHRDLKPDNIMAGSFGQILVLDWGLARVGQSEAPLWTERSADPTNATRYGVVMGTRHFMPPEQLEGDIDRIGPPADVYALGAILFQLLFGEPPPLGDGLEILHFDEQVLRVTGEGLPGGIPDGLEDIARAALSLRPSDRPPNASLLAEQIGDWLEGRERAVRGMRLVERAQAEAQQASVMRKRAEQLLADAEGLKATASKEAVWALEDESAVLRREAGIASARRLQFLQGALTHDPDLMVAHELLARHYQTLQARAELDGDLNEAARHEVFLRHHDRGEFAEWLIGDGMVSLVTEPARCEVTLSRYEEQGRRLVPVPLSTHTTPLVRMGLPRGSYLLTLSAPGHYTARYPVSIGRCEHWNGVRPGDSSPSAIRLLPEGALAEDEVYVPAGWFQAGGETPDVAAYLPAQRVWVDGFVMKRFPVTNDEFAAFLSWLLENGQREKAEELVPRWTSGDASGTPVFSLRPRNVRVMPHPSGEDIPGDWPVILVTWHAAREYADWLADRTHRPWRLPGELEWEKAARGVDGRSYPWGDFMDPAWCCVLRTPGRQPNPAPVNSFPDDVSQYGARGLGGNVLDWCLDAVPERPLIRDDGLLLDPDLSLTAGKRALRGGAWDDTEHRCRVDRRRGMAAVLRHPRVGFRLVFSMS